MAIADGVLQQLVTAIDELTELVERAAAVERAALAARWRDQAEVEALLVIARRTADELRDRTIPDTDPNGLPPSARAEREALAAVALARTSLAEAGVAVLQARMARIQAGEDEPAASTVDGLVAGQRRNPVSRHGPALAHGLSGEIRYVLTRRPRSTIKSLGVSFGLGLLYLGFIRVFEWDRNERLLPYLGLWAISVVMGGSVCVNAMSFDAMRVRAALDGGEQLWRIQVIKNLALFVIVAPLGFLISALLAWRAGDPGAFVKACVLVVCFMLLWLGVGNVLSVGLPFRDEPILRRRASGSLKQFAIAFVVSYLAGYLVNGTLIWRVYAARTLYERLGNAWIPGLLILLSCAGTWLLLTVFGLAVAQQPSVRRALQREIAGRPVVGAQ